MTGRTSSTDEETAYRLAGVAFRAALEKDSAGALVAVMDLNAECAGRGIFLALMFWCDAFADHAADGGEYRGPGRVGFIEESTGRMSTTGEGLSPDVVWAGKLIGARASMNREAYLALLDELPADGMVVAQYVMTVLMSVAATINGLPRGFALMGRG